MRCYIVFINALLLVALSMSQEVFSDMHKERLKYLMNLQRAGVMRLDRILDIGANVGDWTQLVRSVFPMAMIFMIEANPELESDLKAISPDNYEIALLGDRKGMAEFHANRKSTTGGSIYKEYSYIAKWKEQHTEKMKMVTVDHIMKKRDLAPFDFVKIDVQGAELLVLRGATKTLQKAQIVMAEVSIHQYNPGSPSLGDINNFMIQQGFRLYDIMDLRHMVDARSDASNVETLVQMDVLWARAESRIFYGMKYPRPPPDRYQCEVMMRNSNGGGRNESSPRFTSHRERKRRRLNV